jgi:hypothetical protein
MLSQIIENFGQEINNKAVALQGLLIQGDLRQFENELYPMITKLYGALASAMVNQIAASEELRQQAKRLCASQGLHGLRQCTVGLQLRTGQVIQTTSWYGIKRGRNRVGRCGPNGTGRHLLLDYWGCVEKASPAYYGTVTMLSVLCPSFEIVGEVLTKLQIQSEYKRVRTLAYAVGNRCFADRTKVALADTETLAGQRVIISLDGGRTRLREYQPHADGSPTATGKRRAYATPWREPKLFVIQTLTDDGKIAKTHLPLYDAVVGKPDPTFALLAAYLQRLHIEQARHVLFISDGAPWIWQRVAALFARLGVAKEKLTLAIDYYHATQHIAALLYPFTQKQLPESQRKTIFSQLKDDLYHGRIDAMIATVTELARGRKAVLNCLDYFKTYRQQMNYSLLLSLRLPIGSGIVESAVRRVINLRFKSPSSFWFADNVEKLIFLRSVCLAKRWDIMIGNLSSAVANKLAVTPNARIYR